MFEVDIYEEEERLIIHFAGELDERTAVPTLKKLENVVQAGYKALLLNCRKLDYISSAGLGVLMVLHRSCAFKGVPLVLYNLQPRIKNVIELAGMAKLLKIAASKPAAKALLAPLLSIDAASAVETSYEQKHHILHAKLTGKFSATSMAALEKELLKAHPYGMRQVWLNASGLTAISPEAVERLVLNHYWLQQKGIQLILIALDEQLQSALCQANVDVSIPFVATEELAYKYYN